MPELTDTGFYCVQASYNGGYICQGWEGYTDDETQAIDAAKEWLRDPCFEGDSVRVMTIDGELVGTFTKSDV